ncbi:MAG TPA: hypothetical protein VMR98_02600, partial [Candidatus Polarisedimenticolaceae bacterium]|nr:hypothetical protein [Candidatus Polarisedimenticolaceae bacterium]
MSSEQVTVDNGDGYCSGRGCDKKSPSPYCGFKGQRQGNKYVKTQPGSRQILKSPGGLRFGEFEVRHSTICQVEVGEVFFEGLPEPPGFEYVYIRSFRKGRYHKQEKITIKDHTSPIFTAMLASDRQ